MPGTADRANDMPSATTYQSIESGHYVAPGTPTHPSPGGVEFAIQTNSNIPIKYSFLKHGIPSGTEFESDSSEESATNMGAIFPIEEIGSTPKLAHVALAIESGGVRDGDSISTPSFSAASGSASNLIQSTLNLGNSTQRTCGTCGMTYNTSDQLDCTRHQEHHDDYEVGIALSSMNARFSQITQIGDHVDKNDITYRIVRVTATSPNAWKDLAQHVLKEYVDPNLGTSTTPLDKLWGMVTAPHNKDGSGKVQQYTVVLAIRLVKKKERVVGAVLIERIGPGDAWEVTNGHTIFSVPPRNVYLGVNKIWVMQNYRRMGLAAAMLDAARDEVIYGKKVDRSEIAFSAPSSTGSKFATGYSHADEDLTNYDWLEFTSLY